MKTKISENLINYLNSHSRNKIVFHKTNIPEMQTLDVGKTLSLKLKPLVFDSKIGLKSLFIIEELFKNSIIEDSVYGRYLAIENLGILFQTELKVDLIYLIDKFSSTNSLFIKWNGEIKNNYLYFLSEKKGKEINIKNLSHIII